MLLVPIWREAETAARSASKFTALFGLTLRLTDIMALVGGGVLAYRLRFGSFALELAYRQTLLCSVLFALIILTSSSLYRSWRGRGLPAELTRVVSLWTMLFGCMVMYSTLVQQFGGMSRAWWLTWYGLGLAAVISVRVGVRHTAEWLRARGVDQRTAVIVGGGADARRIVATFRARPWAGIHVLGWFATPDGHRYLDESPRLGELDALPAFVEAQRVDQVWIALPMRAQDEIARVLTVLRHSTADIKMVPDLFGLQLLNHSVEQVAGMPVINLRSTPMNGNAHLLKALEDRLLASLILLLIWPLMLAIAIGVKLSSPGPVLFRQSRHGRNGKEIQVWKFRSMHVHDEHAGSVTQATRDDARLTRFGAFLRRTSLDELPQFINVLQGRMSIVGPRPHAVAHNQQYMEQVVDYMQRHRIKPGITGWAQVNGLRGETDTVDKMSRRIELDLHYLQHWSLLLDLRIIVQTVLTGFAGRNAY